MEHAVLQNHQPVGTRGRPPPDFNIDSIASCLEERQGIIGRYELPFPPALDADAHMIHGPPNDDGPMRLAEVDLAAVRGPEAVANQRLLQADQDDVQAVRVILDGLLLQDNVITPRQYRWVLKRLRRSLPAEGDHGMWCAREYARVLERLAQVMLLLTREDYDTAPAVHPVSYECALAILKENTPDFSCPVAYGECLDRLCEEITATYSLLRAADGVYVTRDREQFARRLRSLAAFVAQCA